jgi:hypothetical protein
MIKIVITSEEREKLKNFNTKYYSVDFNRRFNPNGQAKLETRYRGSLGEWAVWKRSGKTLEDYTNYKFNNRLNLSDIILMGKKWDIKTKKTIPPQLWFNSSVEKKQHAHSTGMIDGYIFCNLMHDFSTVYISGFMELADFDKYKISRAAGPDPKDSAGTSKIYERPADCWDVRIDQEQDPENLFDMEELLW